MSDSTIARAFRIIDLLEEDRTSITADEAAAALGTTRSTTYRYIKSLCEAGFLAQLTRGAYALGPRIVELERRLQISDPLLNSARPVLAERAAASSEGAFLLCSLWGEKVLCIHTEFSDAGDGKALELERARGLPFPLFKGAASLAILVNLPIAKRRSLYLRRSDQIAAAGLGGTWAEFRDVTTAMRDKPATVTSGTFGNELTAVAAPILDENADALGSVTRVLPTSRVGGPAHIETISRELKSMVADVSRRLERFVHASRGANADGSAAVHPH